MNEKEQLVKKTLNLSDEEWEGIGEEARNAILKLADPISLEDPGKEERGKLATGIKKVLDLHPEEYGQLPQYQRDKLLQKVNDILG